MMKSFDKTILMYIFEGNPNGRIMSELSNWNGRVYKVSRNEIGVFSKRSDAEYTGVYFLFGKDEENNETVYIGEAENMISRLKQHIRDKEYWNDCIVVISKDNLLNKAHVKYLEHNFYLMAKNAARSTVVNSNVPTCSSISEYDEAMLAEFIENTKLLVNTLGYKTFDSVEDSTIKSQDESIVFEIKAARGADAKGIVVADGFAVLKGSVAASTTVASFPKSFAQLRSKLIEQKIINSSFVFEKDYVFSSPSAAAAVVMGRSANGLTEWKTADHVELKHFDESSVL